MTVPVQAVPRSALLEKVARWILEAFQRSGNDIELGIKLRQVFLRAGFFEPHLHADRFIGGGPAWVGYAHLAGLTKSLLPLIEASGIATAAEIEVDTAYYDLFRVENGKIAEHWDTLEAIPPRSEWKNPNGKFGFESAM